MENPGPGPRLVQGARDAKPARLSVPGATCSLRVLTSLVVVLCENGICSLAWSLDLQETDAICCLLSGEFPEGSIQPGTIGSWCPAEEGILCSLAPRLFCPCVSTTAVRWPTLKAQGWRLRTLFSNGWLLIPRGSAQHLERSRLLVSSQFAC